MLSRLTACCFLLVCLLCCFPRTVTGVSTDSRSALYPPGRGAETVAFSAPPLVKANDKSWLNFDPTAPQHAIARTQRNLRQAPFSMAPPIHGPDTRRGEIGSNLNILSPWGKRGVMHPTDIGHSALVDLLLQRHGSDSSMPQRRKVKVQDRLKAQYGIDPKAYRRILQMSSDAHVGDGMMRGIDGCARTKYGHGYAEGKIAGSCLRTFQEPFFEDSSHQLPGSADNTQALRYGMAVLNMDNSSDWEVFIGGFGSVNIALKWNSTKGGFDNFAREANLQAKQFDSTGVVACDLDGDGTEEIYVLNTGNLGGDEHVGDHVFKRVVKRRKGALSDVPFFNDVLQHEFDGNRKDELEPTSVACVDVHGSGRYHVATANFDQPIHLFALKRANKIFKIEDQAKPALFGGAQNINISARSIVAGPILGDAQHTDIFLGTELMKNYYFRNRGDGKFEEISLQLNIADNNTTALSACIVDTNGDGLLDILYANHGERHRLFLQHNKSGHFTFESALKGQQIVGVSDARAIVAADFDNDGQIEVFFNTQHGPNRMFKPQYGKDWERLNLGAASEPFMHGTGAVVADFDGDGVLDLLLAHGEDRKEKLTFYKVRQAAQNNYLRVAPQTKYGAPARGSKVTLWYMNVQNELQVQVRVIDTGSGQWSSSEPVAHFGLGKAKVVKCVRVMFPDGHTKDVHFPAINTNLHVS